MYIVRKPMQQDDRPAIGGAALFIRNPQNPRLDLLQHHGAPVDILLAKCSVPPTAVSWFMARDHHQNGHLADEIACLSQMTNLLVMASPSIREPVHSVLMQGVAAWWCGETSSAPEPPTRPRHRL